MQLTRFTDYAIRVLLHAGARDEGLSSIAEIARTYRISKNNIMKVAQDLGRAGFLTNVRGRNGGIKLARPASEIRIGDVDIAPGDETNSLPAGLSPSVPTNRPAANASDLLPATGP